MVTEEFGQGDDGKIYRKAGDTEIKASDEESREAEEIVFRAKSDGSYMKAPNGEATKLSKSQWVQVRTRAFKDWFGDWELWNKNVDVVSVSSNHGFTNFADAKKWAKENICRVYSDMETGVKEKF